MELLQAHLGSILMTGLGLAWTLLGYRLVRFHALTLGVIALAAAGAAGGLLLGSPLAMAGFALIGALLGYFLGPVLWHVYIALMAGGGGAAIGIAISALAHPTNPTLVIASTAVACAAIALLDAKAITIAWTSVAGACLALLGLLTSTLWPGVMTALTDAPSRRDALAAMAVFSLLVATGLLFQARTNRASADGTPSPKPTPRPAPETATA